MVVLRDPSGQADATGRKGGRWLGVFVDHSTEAFLEDLKKIAAVQWLNTDAPGEYPLLEMIVSSKQAALPEIELICRAHNVTLYRIYTRKDERPSFDQPARLTQIPKSKMAMELVKRLTGGRQIELIQLDLGGDSKRLFLQFLDYLIPTSCWELSVGPLKQMADLVCSLPESV